MKKNRGKKSASPSELSPEDLSGISGGQGGTNPGMFTAYLQRNHPENLQRFRDSLQDPVGLGDVIEGIVNHNAGQALSGLAGVASLIPGGAALRGVSAGVKAGLQIVKGGAKGYRAGTK